MPFHKKSYAKKKAPLAKQVESIKKQLRVRKPEVKNILAYALGTAPTLTGSIISFNDIAQSVTSTGRVGLDIQPTSLNIHAVLKFNFGGSANYQQSMRIIMVRDVQQVQDTAPTVASILHDPAYAMVSFYSEVTKGRYQILSDNLFNFTAQAGNSIYKFNKTYNLSKHKIHYNGANSTDIQKGGIYMLLISSEVTYTPTLDWGYKMNYIDC